MKKLANTILIVAILVLVLGIILRLFNNHDGYVLIVIGTIMGIAGLLLENYRLAEKIKKIEKYDQDDQIVG